MESVFMKTKGIWLPFSLKRKFNVKRIIFIIFCYVISE